MVKKSKLHIFYTWAILFSFIAGQVAVYAHQHINRKASLSSVRQNRATVTDKCQLCDAMHHSSMVKESHDYTVSVVVSKYLYIPGKYDFKSISLILSDGRSPPVAS